MLQVLEVLDFVSLLSIIFVIIFVFISHFGNTRSEKTWNIKCKPSHCQGFGLQFGTHMYIH
jgi:hypothetical protein